MRSKKLLSFFGFTCLFTVLFCQSHTYTGTGFFISIDGLIMTCDHVIEDAGRVLVKVGNDEYPAEVLSRDSEADLAVLKIDYSSSYYFSFLSFNEVSLGDKVFVLGFPLSDILGSDIRLTDGIVSARSGVNSDHTYFQISAPVQPGNSGGPIFNESYEVIGIAALRLSTMSTIMSSGAIPQNVNFGVKSDFAISLVKSNRARYTGRVGNISNINQASMATVQVVCYEQAEVYSGTIEIFNNTGYTVYYVYISPSSSSNWGADRLGSEVLYTGDTVKVSSLDISSRTPYDIMLVDEDNDTYTMSNLTLRANQRIEFRLSDIDDTSPLFTASNSFITLINNTGYTIFYVYVSPSSSNNWGIDLLGEDVLLTGNSVRVPLPENTNEQYDIKLIDLDEDSYTRMNVRLVNNQQIEFTIMDIDL